jgi:hypothetical protein
MKNSDYFKNTSEAYKIIRNALLKRQIVKATYNEYQRLLCPHIIGIRGSEERCFCYQFGGDSSNGECAGAWKCLRIGRMKDISVEEGEWHTDENVRHDRKQYCIAIVDLMVKI